jgi:hypothetical protein
MSGDADSAPRQYTPGCYNHRIPVLPIPAVLAFAWLVAVPPAWARAHPAGATPPPLAVGQAPPAEETRLREELARRLGEYAALRARLEAALPALGPESDATAIHARRMELARRLRVARGRAHEGDLFTRPIRGLLRRLVARALTAEDLARLRAELRRDEAPRVEVRVGAAYLGSEGLVTTPPAILATLPPLPADLEYRFVGEALVLRDARAGLVVDFVHDALPPRGRPRSR